MLVRLRYLELPKRDKGLIIRCLVKVSDYSRQQTTMLAIFVKCYRRFLVVRDRGDLNKHTPVITHVYSYLMPREVGVRIGPIKIQQRMDQDIPELAAYKR